MTGARVWVLVLADGDYVESERFTVGGCVLRLRLDLRWMHHAKTQQDNQSYKSSRSVQQLSAEVQFMLDVAGHNKAQSAQQSKALVRPRRQLQKVLPSVPRRWYGATRSLIGTITITSPSSHTVTAGIGNIPARCAGADLENYKAGQTGTARETGLLATLSNPASWYVT
jgi:hypothetical protein